jgi:hypothetical protein
VSAGYTGPDPGLCAGCANVRIIENRRGSRFYLCELSQTDPRFPRYPRLPVLRCRGYRPASDAESVAHVTDVPPPPQSEGPGAA